MFGKKNNKLPEIAANQENSEAICSRIRVEADEEVKSILHNARVQVRQSLDAAEKEAGEKKQSIRKTSGQELQKEKEKNASIFNLEKKRLILGEQDKFVQTVFAQVAEACRDFRKGRDGYTRFLEKAIIEGIKVLAVADPVISYAAEDEEIFNAGFLKNIENNCRQVVDKNCAVKARKGDFSDPGVVVNSSDGKLFFDNRLLTRLERSKEKVYMELLKEQSD